MFKLSRLLHRSGRFDCHVHLSLPNHQERVDLFRYYLSKLPSSSVDSSIRSDASDGDGSKGGSAGDHRVKGRTVHSNFIDESLLEEYAELTDGYSGADICSIANQVCAMEALVLSFR